VIVFPVIAAAVALAFGLHLLVRFVRRGRLHEGMWSLAMLMYAAASAALASGVVGGWTAAEFRVYWLFGAVLTVPYLAQGELYLLIRRRWLAHVFLGILLAATAWAVAEVRTAPLNQAALDHELPGGGEVFGDGTVAHRMAPLYVWPTYLLLLVGVVWSAMRIRGREELRPLFLGLLLIALGATIAATGSGIGAVRGSLPILALGLAGGASVMYWGFLTATRPASAPADARPAAA
jgi:hypothetical protein